jgi:AraC-like DNA-binding protein
MLVFLISNILSIKIYSPFRKIIDKHSPSAMKGIVSGNLNEYGLLDSMFNNMFSRINDLQTMLERNSVMIRHNFLVELLNNRLKGDKFENLYKLSGVNFTRRYFCIVFFTVDKSKNSSTSNENDQLLKYGMIDYIRCFDKEGITCYPVDISSTGITTIINTDMDNLRQIKVFVDQAEAFCLAHFGVYIPVGVGNFVEDLKEINQSYVFAIMSLQYKFIFPEKFTFYFDDISQIKNTESITDYNLSEKLKKYLKLMSLQEIENLLGEFVRLARIEPLSYRLVRKEASSLLNTFILYLNNMEVDIKEVLDDSQIKILTHPDNINCYTEAMISAASTAFDYFSNKKNCKNSELVDLVKKYVKNNLHQDISLNVAADVVHMSPYYLSKIFKEETNVNYIDFITVCKIDKSKELLLTTNLSIEEITSRVGYNHVTYFTRKFRELTGKTPGLYRSDNLLKSNKQLNG